MTSSSAAPVAGGSRPVPDRLPVGTLLLLAAVVFAAVTTEVLPVGLLPQIAEDLGVEQARIGWWVSAYAVVVAVGALPVTALVARWPQRRVLLVLALLYAASNVVVVAVDSFWVALGARLLSGLAHAAVFSVVVALAVELSPPARRGRAIAVVNSGVGLALALGVPLGTAVGTAWGWRWGFAVMAAVLLVLAAVAVVVLPRSRGGPAEGRRPSVLGELRRRALLLVAVVTVVLLTGHYTAYTYVSPVALDAGVAEPAVSLVLLGYGGASLLGLAVAGAVVDRFPVVSLRATVAALAAVLLMLAVVSGAPATVALVVVWGAVFGALPLVLQTAALRAVVVPPAAPAVVNASFNVGIAVGALLGGRLLGLGTPALGLAAGALAVVALALTSLVERRP